MSIYKNIQRLAKQNKLSVSELERRLDFSNGQIRRWDEKKPSVDRVQKVAKFFEVSVDSILGESTDKEIEEDKDIRIMQRAAKNMSEEDRKKAIKMFEAVFDNWDEITKENDNK